MFSYQILEKKTVHHLKAAKRAAIGGAFDPGPGKPNRKCFTFDTCNSSLLIKRPCHFLSCITS